MHIARQPDCHLPQHPQFIADILKWRASTTENHEILTLLNSKGQVATSLTCAQLHKKAERVGCLLLEKGHINTGDHVALIYPPGVDLIAAFYGCLYVGAVPVTIRPPHPQNLQSTVNTVRTVVDVSKSSIILSTLSVIKLLKSKVSPMMQNSILIQKEKVMKRLMRYFVTLISCKIKVIQQRKLDLSFGFSDASARLCLAGGEV